jgi:hypothetical protein
MDAVDTGADPSRGDAKVVADATAATQAQLPVSTTTLGGSASELGIERHVLTAALPARRGGGIVLAAVVGGLAVGAIVYVVARPASRVPAAAAVAPVAAPPVAAPPLAAPAHAVAPDEARAPTAPAPVESQTRATKHHGTAPRASDAKAKGYRGSKLDLDTDFPVGERKAKTKP